MTLLLVYLTIEQKKIEGDNLEIVQPDSTECSPLNFKEILFFKELKTNVVLKS